MVAYFSMEIALHPAMPTYAGGLGVLAGDTLRSAADLGIPMVGVTLIHRHGYFAQELDSAGNQREQPSAWNPDDLLEPMKPVISLTLEGRTIRVRAWRYLVQGANGSTVPVYLLDTMLNENAEEDRHLTDSLYGGDPRYRLLQEAILGLGGVALLPLLGHSNIASFHLNEGHAALLAFALMEKRLGPQRLREATPEDVHAVRDTCVFTTHTPVPAGHDQFTLDLVRRVLGDDRVTALERTRAVSDGKLNMTYLALYASRYINGVAMHHGEISRGMFPDYPIRAITNGVHSATWVTPPFARLFDEHIPDWRRDNLYLRYAVGIPLQEISDAHAEAKRFLLALVKERSGVELTEATFTIGFARRATPYKRADFVFRDLDRLRRIDQQIGQLQFVFGGKAHPQDEGGKAMIREVHAAARQLMPNVPVVYLEGFDWSWAPLLYAGVDLWLNTPQRPQEASGTSGMKAALNGVPSLSVLDGWWLEGWYEGVTGWSIGHAEIAETEQQEVASLYEKLEQVIVPMYYGRPSAYTAIMRSTVAVNGSFFNAQRMVSQYWANAYQRSVA